MAFKPITERLPIVNATAGKNIVVDGDAIIHRALRSCNCKEIAHILWRDAGRVPDKLLQPLIKSFLKMIHALEETAKSIHVVVDGERQPLKAAENMSRKEQNDKHFALAIKAEVAGDSRKAQNEYYSATYVTPEMKHALKEALKKSDIAFTFAPYEGDAQMAHLSQLGPDVLVVSDDDDMFKYGVDEVLCKVDYNDGKADYIQLQLALDPSSGTPLAGFSPDMVIAASIIKKCDFSTGPTPLECM